ncbi:DUF6979 family protein [Brevibacillus sp. FIR094]|uniref:DUF6979 family protein n=1 Tax=Brevibacillus sp. FIR094 TaxID=3134809 RepID=UPI003D1D8A40
MGKYGETALLAVKLIESKQAATPREAWKKASAEIFSAGSSKDKDCPRSTFLGLCEEDLVRGITRGKYTTSLKSKSYAIQGVELLKQDPSFTKSPLSLWKAICADKVYNSQMDVVISLWENNYIVKKR